MDGLQVGIPLGTWLEAGPVVAQSPQAGASRLLTQVFSLFVFPVVLLATTVVLIILMRRLIRGTQDPYERGRRLAAAMLPVIAHVFVRVAFPSSDVLREVPPNPALSLIGGILAGLLLVELARIFERSGGSLSIPVYILALSAVATFLVDSTLAKGLDALHFLLFGLLIAVGLDVVVRGVPRPLGGPSGTREPDKPKGASVA